MINLPVETTSVMAHTENSGEGRVLSNSQATNLSHLYSLAAGDIIESNKAMFNVLTEVYQKILTSMGAQLHEHSKCQWSKSIS